MPAISVLHAALEYGDASLGGLGAVTTQMVEAQNKFLDDSNLAFVANIITPYYKKLFKYENPLLVAQIQHLYNDNIVSTNIFLANDDAKMHFMLAPTGRFDTLFDVDSINTIYIDNKTSTFIERVKYFNSAVAAYLNNANNGISHPDPAILILHDWQAALLPRILKDVYHNNKIKSLFIVHVGNIDFGGYHAAQLQGIGLKFAPGWHMLKAVGLNCADRIVTVSSAFLHECITEKSDNPNSEFLRKLFVLAKVKGKVFGILNGFDYNKFAVISRGLEDKQNIYLKKLKFKHQLAAKLSSWLSSWRINPNLPFIFFIGRYSREKGVGTFKQLIRIIKDRAVFFALGRGLTESVHEVMQKHSKKTDNIFISNNEEDQKTFKEMMLAAADFGYICSHRDACNVVVFEDFCNGLVGISSGVGGLQDSVKPLIYTDRNNTSGNSFIYQDQPDDSENPSLTQTVDQALSFWEELTPSQKNLIHLRLMDEARGFDWLAPGGAISKYLNVCRQIV